MAEERHPCEYCGTMLDDDDCVMIDIPAVNGPMLHTASQCREYVYAAMTSYKRDRASIVETVACWVDNRLDEKWADKMRERERAAAAATGVAGVSEHPYRYQPLPLPAPAGKEGP